MDKYMRLIDRAVGLPDAVTVHNRVLGRFWCIVHLTEAEGSELTGHALADDLDAAMDEIAALVVALHRCLAGGDLDRLFVASPDAGAAAAEVLAKLIEQVGQKGALRHPGLVTDAAAAVVDAVTRYVRANPFEDYF